MRSKRRRRTLPFRHSELGHSFVIGYFVIRHCEAGYFVISRLPLPLRRQFSTVRRLSYLSGTIPCRRLSHPVQPMVSPNLLIGVTYVVARGSSWSRVSIAEAHRWTRSSVRAVAWCRIE